MSRDEHVENRDDVTPYEEIAVRDEAATKRLNGRAAQLRVMAFVLILSFAVTIPLLYEPLRKWAESEDPSWNLGGGAASQIGVVGLAILFCLYSTHKQRELDATREALLREERELEEVRSRTSELSALFETSATLNLQLSLQTILEIIVRRVVSTLKAQQASIMLYDPATHMIETRASYGLESEFARKAKKHVGEGIAGWVVAHQEAMLLGEKPEDSDLGTHYKSNRRITSALSLPLQAGRRCVGVLNVNRINQREHFQEHHRDILRLFTEHVGAVIERAEAMERLDTRANDLEADLRRLRETSRMKDVFLSTASHELKTPLTSVIGYAEILDETPDLPAEKRGEFLKGLRSEARRLLDLIEDILDLTRLETGKLTLRREMQSLNEIAAAAVATAGATAKKDAISLVEEFEQGLPEIWIDASKVRQAVVNLITNAVKFSPSGGDVTIRTRRDGEHLVAEVIDRGPGVPPEESTHIFELFGQGARQSERRPGGLGIGLHLVKRITELHGGFVGVNSIQGEGSTFWIRLPVAASEFQPTEEEMRRAA